MYLMIIVGLALLVVGGDILVRGAVRVAERLGVSSMIVGIVLVGFGTSTPELVTSIKATLDGAYGIAVGNVVGSNIANILLILGVGACLSFTAFTHQTLKRDGIAMLIAALALVIVISVQPSIDWKIGLVFLILLACYLGYCIYEESRESKPTLHEREAQTIDTKPTHIGISMAMAVAGIALTILGAHLLVNGSVSLAQHFGVSDAIIGLTIVAVGTSLPELAATISAAIKKESDLAVGNIVGSNIYNILAILGITSVIATIEVAPSIIAVDQWIMLAVTIIVLLLAWRYQAIRRWHGVLFLLSYAGYIGWLAMSA